MNKPLITLLIIAIYYVFAYIYIRRKSLDNQIITREISTDNRVEEFNDLGLTTNNIQSGMSFGNMKTESITQLVEKEFDDFFSEKERYDYLENINQIKSLNLSSDIIEMASKTPFEFADIVQHI